MKNIIIPMNLQRLRIKHLILCLITIIANSGIEIAKKLRMFKDVANAKCKKTLRIRKVIKS